MMNTVREITTLINIMKPIMNRRNKMPILMAGKREGGETWDTLMAGR